MDKNKSDEMTEKQARGNVEEETMIEKETDLQETKAVDGGYGWLVVLGCFLAHTVTGGIERSDGVFFLQFLQRFRHSAQFTAWPGAIMSTMNLVMGPLASTICNRYSVRTSVMIAGLLMSAGCILDGFATNFYFLFFSHSFLLGLGRGLCYAPGLIIVAMYFDKRRGLATGIGSSGVGAGTFMLVPISQVLFDSFGFQGAFLIFGGIALNINVAAMLYRPFSTHSRFSRSPSQCNYKVSLLDVAEVIIQSETISDVASLRSWRSSSVSTSRRYSHDIKNFQEKSDKENKKISRQSCNDDSCLISNLKICFPKEIRDENDTTSKKLCHLYLLKNPPFLLYCLSIWFFTMAMKAAFMFIPALVKFKGNTDSEASLVLSITGVVDCFARIGAGFLLDTKTLRTYRTIIYNLVMFSMAGVAFVLPSMESFESLIAACCVYGLFTGTYVSQKSVILVDILGVQHMANSLGILIFFQGFGTLLGPPLSGALKDYFGSFSEAFYLGGGFMMAAGSIMATSNVFLVLQRRKENINKRSIR